MQRVLLNISYNGKSYSGFQIQKNSKSIQSDLEEALFKVFNVYIKITGCSRTDAGVSALSYCAHFDMPKKFDLEKLPKALNHYLGEGIRVLQAKLVKSDFNARYFVKRKTYIYVCYLSKQNIPVYDTFAIRLDPKINIEGMKNEAVNFCGKHNFKSFCSAGSSVTNFEREIFSFKIVKKGKFLIFEVCGNGFLYNMVRIMVGTLIEIGLGKNYKVQEVINALDRNVAGKTAPANGLYLKKVTY